MWSFTTSSFTASGRESNVNRAVFVDRDGVINELVSSSEGPDSPRSVEEFKLLAGVGGAIRRLNELGLPVVLISNQPGAAKGKYPARNLQAITERMKAALAEENATLQGIYYCMHHPQATVAEYRQACECRKPKSGLLIQAGRDLGLDLTGSYMVGDQPRDMIAGRSVGCTTVLVASALGRAEAREANYVCNDLEAAAGIIVRLEAASLASL